MRYCFFAYFEFEHVQPGPLGQVPQEMARGLSHLPGLTQALVHTPLPADTPHAFPDDQKPPHLAWQLYADQPEDLEAWLMPQGALNLALPQLLAMVGQGGRVVQQQRHQDGGFLLLTREAAVLFRRRAGGVYDVRGL